MVPNCIGKPPAACTPSFEADASRFSERLQGVISFQEDAIPIWGFTQSASPIPTARNIPRAGERSSPSVTIPDLGFIGLLIGVLSLISTIPVILGELSGLRLTPTDKIHESQRIRD
jgi:hypothetical protein